MEFEVLQPGELVLEVGFDRDDQLEVVDGKPDGLLVDKLGVVGWHRVTHLQGDRVTRLQHALEVDRGVDHFGLAARRIDVDVLCFERQLEWDVVLVVRVSEQARIECVVVVDCDVLYLCEDEVVFLWFDDYVEVCDFEG